MIDLRKTRRVVTKKGENRVEVRYELQNPDTLEIVVLDDYTENHGFGGLVDKIAVRNAKIAEINALVKNDEVAIQIAERTEFEQMKDLLTTK